jgi:hypothetical protein
MKSKTPLTLELSLRAALYVTFSDTFRASLRNVARFQSFSRWSRTCWQRTGPAQK